MTTLVVLQPGYLPWIGFFDLLRQADYFVYYDDVQFDKHGWRNRNRVKGPNGANWLTVPVLHSGLGLQAIKDIRIDNSQPWRRKHITTLRQCYAKAASREPYFTELAALIDQPWEKLIDLDIAAASLIANWLGLTPPAYRSSDMLIEGDRNRRLINLCHRFSATTYLSANAAQTYIDIDLFARNGIAVRWQNYAHPTYAQQHGEFLPYMSALDLVFNQGALSREIMETGTKHDA
ncbi:conserved hypothetical protein [Rhodospirillaceae bacterium LM-1]|nr:conserved hypothetical protein [Rhodospirillaceae bacterium LM-1]